MIKIMNFLFYKLFDCINYSNSRDIMCKVCAICATKSMKLGTLPNYNIQIILSLRPNSNLPQGGLHSNWACCHGTIPPPSNSK